MSEIKEGDVFRWFYKNDEEYRAKHSGSGTAYWCMDNQAVAFNHSGNLVLVDTYWDGPDYNLIRVSDNTKFLDIDKVDLEFVCNINDLQGLHSWEIEDYDKVYNLSYQKGSYKVFATDLQAYQKGPSKEAVLKKLQTQLQRAREDLRSAQWSITQIEKEIEDLEWTAQKQI
jgi:hypothetical protein